MRSWVDTQIDLHTYLAEQDVLAAKIKSPDTNSPNLTTKTDSVLSSSPDSVTSLSYQSVSGYTTSSVKTPTIKSDKFTSTTPKLIKELFAGLDTMNKIITEKDNVHPQESNQRPPLNCSRFDSDAPTRLMCTPSSRDESLKNGNESKFKLVKF